MKKIESLFFAICMLFSISACGAAITEAPSMAVSNESTANSENSIGTESAALAESSATSASAALTENSSNEGKVLVAYFSRADENYGVGVIEKGNTEIVAEIIAEETGGDLFHIERETPYPAEYDACTEEAKQEKDGNARPALAEDISPDDYDVIYLGYPIWWGDMPMPVYTWLESHDFEGKTVIPFCTHAGSGLSGTVDSIKNICTGATVLDGFEIRGSTAQDDYNSAKEEILEWMRHHDFTAVTNQKR